jgi:hypothetical protein
VGDLDYAQITTDATTTATAAASAATMITSNNITYDGTPCWLSCSAPT